ncbi:MAG TPA: PhoH family protein [Bacillales bacterium]|nr:PhoH family protein [Bacillales bacterium]
MKTFVLDTNVLIHDPDSIFRFEEHDVVVLAPVYEELDKLKSRGNGVGWACNLVFQRLERLISEGNYDKVKEDDGHTWTVIRLPKQDGRLILHDHEEDAKVYADHYLLKWVAAHEKAILVTKDRPLRIRAMKRDIHVEDYTNDRVHELYTGFCELVVDADLIETFYLNQKLPLASVPTETDLYENQFVQLTSALNPKQTALAIVKKQHLLLSEPLPEMKIKPRSRDQHLAFSMLVDPQIPMVTISGDAGTGKTLLAMTVGDHFVRLGKFHSMLITRPMVGMGKDIGALPGEKEEKMRPWISPFVDNLKTLYLKEGEFASSKDLLERFTDKGRVEIEALTYVRGRTWENQFIIVDEAQNLTPHEMKAILTRVGRNSKIVLIGDPTDNQIDHPFLTPQSNGLVYAVERMKTSALAAHLHFSRVERSPLVQDIVRLL